MAKTIEALQGASGAPVFKWIALIEGCKYVLTDCESTSAVQSALAGTDWASAEVIPWLFVDLQNQQSIELWNPFTTHGRCTLRVADASDTFGSYVGKRLSGAQTILTSTHDRNDTTLNVASTTNFPSSGEAHVGVECFSYSAVGATSFTVTTRGKYSPFGCDSTGSGGSRFAGYHRKGIDSTHQSVRPLVTQLPRIWVGRRAGLWLHTWDGSSLNTRADAQLVYAGRIAALADDPATFLTVIDLEHIGNTDIKDAPLGRDQWGGVIAEGIELVTGRAFTFFDIKNGTKRTADDLTVVAGAPASANEIQTGFYTGNEIADRVNKWLGGELSSGRIWGHYNLATPVPSNVGPRTKMYWRVEDASAVDVSWGMTMPGEIAVFLGIKDISADLRGQQSHWGSYENEVANGDYLRQGDATPYATLLFHQSGPGNSAQELTKAVNFEIEDERGTFYDQYSLLPYSVKRRCSSTEEWGIFLFNEKTLMVAAYDNSTATSPKLKNCWIAPWQFAATSNEEAAVFTGRRVDEPDTGPITVRQVMMLTHTLAGLLLRIAYSSGTSGYNHSTYDTLPYGLGWSLPGSLLGPEFERSVQNMPGANQSAVLVLDEPTRFADIFVDDLIFRWMFLRWRDGGFEFAQWKTPIASNAAKSYAGTSLHLTESNKAEPAGDGAHHRVASLEANDHCRPIIKIDYARDFGSTRDAKYTKSIQIEDQRAVDDAGGNAKPFTIRLRNTFAQFTLTGPSIEEMAKDFIARMPMASKATRKIVRTIDMRYWEGYAPGDIAVVTDNYARDPVTGERGIASRPAMITRLSYSPGGPTPTGTRPRDMYGEVELMFLDVSRGREYSPAAQVDDTQANAGYNAGGPTITCYAHKYSHALAGLGTRRTGVTIDDTEDADAEWFPAGSKIHIIEIDPADPANPTKWEREVLSQTGNTITLTAALSAPAWDSTKKYRIVPQKYSQVVTAQQDYAFQADDSDELVEDDEPPWTYSAGAEVLSYDSVTGSEKAEFMAQVAYGDGRPYDAGYDHGLAYTLNAFIDYKSAHQSPFLDSSAARAQTGGPFTDTWRVLHCIPIFLGTEHLTATVRRTYTMALWWRSFSVGQSSSIRVSIARQFPAMGIDVPATNLDDGWVNVAHKDAFAISSTLTTTSDTWQQSSDIDLELNCKDLFFGIVWLVIEGTNAAECRGLAKLIEGPREVS